MGLEANRHEEAQPVALVIDDSVDVHRLLRARLKPEGLELVQALSGPEGLTLAVSKPPSVVLLDLDMPEMDGFEVLRNLKENPATQHVPVIVLSGLQSPQDKVTAFDLGAVDYVTKPFDLTELRVRVRAALRLSQLLTMLSQRAQIDGLTGLWNRAHFDKRWPDEVSGCVRHGRALSMAILDMDHFKSVNDTYGHRPGTPSSRGWRRSSSGSAASPTSRAAWAARSSRSSCRTRTSRRRWCSASASASRSRSRSGRVIPSGT